MLRLLLATAECRSRGIIMRRNVVWRRVADLLTEYSD